MYYVIVTKAQVIVFRLKYIEDSEQKIYINIANLTTLLHETTFLHNSFSLAL